MTKTKDAYTISIRCDHCGRVEEATQSSRIRCKHKLQHEGWEMKNYEDICPVCARSKR